ncbi:general odorant-binding protein 69a [Acyrthosiphon pisum]|uniref:Odorant-binding protein n=1 Tax=Acyrthosiphon pisum TaxID=7029 RepID=A0A8R2D389_ACYPI|nr:general odorant-binding protein 69a [Acyrthosiphon pisum]|eukprot:XP_016659328.1 PREDICTED: general odorant-binding protein 69a [Acyrthosiphon pisum]
MALLIRPKTDGNDAIEEMKNTLYNICSTKYRITEVSKLKNNVKKSIISDDPTFKCFLKCCFDEMSLIDEDGIIDGDSMIQMTSDDDKLIAEQVIPNCIKTVKQDSCEAAFDFVSCVIKLNPSTAALLPL